MAGDGELYTLGKNILNLKQFHRGNFSLLREFCIGDNNFVGSIPNFIQNLTNLQNLVIQGSGLSGPIPPDIFKMTNLQDLRISDLNGNASSVLPDLSSAAISLRKFTLAAFYTRNFH